MEKEEIVTGQDSSLTESTVDESTVDAIEDDRVIFARKYLDLTIFPKSKKKADVAEVKAVESLMKPTNLNISGTDGLEYGKKSGLIRGGLSHATQDRNF